MSPAPSNAGRLQVLHAVEEGWGAFCRAPWAFLLFQVLAGLVLLPFLALTGLGAARLADVEGLMGMHPIGAWMALIAGVIGYVIVVLWTLVGLTRGAWISLEGRKPAFADFTRWNRPAAARLLGSAVLLALVAAVAGAIAAAVGAGLGQLNAALAVIPAVVVTIFYVWLAITQKFLVQVALLGNQRPLDCLRSGFNVVNPSWGMVFWLAIVEAVIQAVSALFSYGGLVVVVPVILCVTTAAYRQLFGPEDRTGLLG